MAEKKQDGKMEDDREETNWMENKMAYGQTTAPAKDVDGEVCEAG